MVFLASLVFAVSLAMLGANAELVAVVQVFRHGQRVPVKFYPTSPNSAKSYWGGLDLEQLTNEGKRQHYELGQFTRNRYSNFLPAKYDKSFFYAQTTDIDRTHMSAQSNIYSLFQATGDQIWRRNLNWQPIPLHTAKSSIMSSQYICSNHDILLTDAVNDAESQAIDQKYAAIYKYTSKNSGLNITSFFKIHTVFDVTKIETDVGLPVPTWVKSVYPEPLSTIAGHLFQVLTRTTQMKRLTIGTLLNSIVNYFENMAIDASYSQKYQMYSGHDSTISAFLDSFGAFNPPYPPQFASTIYMELHLVSWRPIIRVFSKDGSNIKQISVNGCPLDCPLSQFRTVLSEIIIDEDALNQECAQIAKSNTTRLMLSDNRFTTDEVREQFKNFST